jgi:asparagine synthase (glutamine-hydrolysing)
MPGLCGLVTSGEKIVSETILQTFEEVHKVKGMTYIRRSFGSDQVAIINLLTGLLPMTLTQPASDPTDNSLLFLEGEIFNLEDLICYAKETGDRSPCGILLALFLERGDEFISLVNGEFNIVIYQKRENRLIVFSDHIASMPMYYVEEKGRLLFGSEKKSFLPLLSECPTIDSLGLLQIVAHRHNLDELTFLRGIRRLVPGSRLEYAKGRLSVTRHQKLAFAVPEVPRPVEELLDEWATRLRHATQLRLNGKQRVLISLSAGLDSRAIACAIPRDFRPVSSRTRGVEGSLEATLAAAIADRLGFNHFREEPSTVPHSSIIPKIAWRTECETHFQHAISLSNHPTIKDRGDHIAGGWLGDVSSGGHISPRMLVPRSRQSFIDQVFRRYLAYSVSSLSRVFSRGIMQEIFPQLQTAFLESFSHFDAATNIQLYETWDLHQRQARMTTSSMPVDSYAFEKIRPFYDKEYLKFTLTLPFRVRLAQSLYQTMIYRLGPEIRSIPSSNTMQKVRGTILGNRMNKGLEWTQKAVTKGVRRVHSTYRNRIERHTREDMGSAIRKDLQFRCLIEDFVSSRDFDSAIFNQSGITTMLEEHYRGVADHTELLGYVATFSAGIPLFLNRTPRCPREAEPFVACS